MGCYNLVGEDTAERSSTRDPIGRLLGVQDTITVKPGDVVGISTEFAARSEEGESESDDDSESESSGPNGLQLNTLFNQETVWYEEMAEQGPFEVSPSLTCDSVVGTSGVLSMLSNAAPVLRVEVSKWQCHSFFFQSVAVFTNRSSNLGSTHFRSRNEFQSTNGCGLSQSELQSELGVFTLDVNPG